MEGGDPIEAGAILATYGQERGDAAPLALGSIKSNIGHTQAAAGVAGVIKMALAMRHGVLPRTLHLDEPTPHVDWSSGQVELLSEERPWEPNGHPRRAGVSSFGASGTNAHLILEEAPRPAVREAPPSERAEPELPPLPATPLLLSAKGEDALRLQATRLAAHLRSNPELDPLAAAATLAARARLSHGAAALGAEREELLGALDALGAGEPHPDLVFARAHPGKLAFLFSGQGAQRPGMGRELYEAFPAFAAALDEVCAELDPHLQRPLKQLLFAPEGGEEAALLDRTEFTQPALFAIEVALFRLLGSWGLRPDFLIGHSIGELSAAHLAGVFDLADACRLIAARGALMGALPAGGAMVAVEASEAEVASQLPPGVSIAGLNSPSSVVLSGEREAVWELGERWQEQGRRTTRLRVSHAFHSELIEPMLADFAAVAREISYAEPRIPIASNLSGELLSPEQATDPAYWVAQVREPVRFAAGIEHLAGAAATTFLELGPDSALAPMARACLGEAEATVASLQRRERPEARTLLGSLALAHLSGAKVDWSRLWGERGRPALPTYPFQRRRYWLESGAGAADVSAAGLLSPEHPLLGAAVPLAGGDGWLLSGRISLQTHSWLADHAVFGATIFPGTGFVELALRAAELAGMEAISELTLGAPLVLPEQGAVQVQVSVGESGESGERPIAIHSRPDEPEAEWVQNASGSLGAGVAGDPAGFGEWPPPGAEPVSADDLYERCAELGIDYGPAFQGLRAAWRRDGEIFAEVELAEEQVAEAERFAIHPALLDAALHATMLAGEDGGELRVPFAWSGVGLAASGAASLRVALRAEGADDFSLSIADADGVGVASVERLAARPIDPSQLQAAGSSTQTFFALDWSPLALSESEAAAGEVRLVECVPDSAADPPAAAQELCERGPRRAAGGDRRRGPGERPRRLPHPRRRRRGGRGARRPRRGGCGRADPRRAGRAPRPLPADRQRRQRSLRSRPAGRPRDRRGAADRPARGGRFGATAGPPRRARSRAGALRLRGHGGDHRRHRRPRRPSRPPPGRLLRRSPPRPDQPRRSRGGGGARAAGGADRPRRRGRGEGLRRRRTRPGRGPARRHPARASPRRGHPQRRCHRRRPDRNPRPGAAAQDDGAEGRGRLAPPRPDRGIEGCELILFSSVARHRAEPRPGQLRRRQRLPRRARPRPPRRRAGRDVARVGRLGGEERALDRPRRGGRWRKSWATGSSSSRPPRGSSSSIAPGPSAAPTCCPRGWTAR